MSPIVGSSAITTDEARIHVNSYSHKHSDRGLALLVYPVVLMGNVMSIGILNRMEEGDLAAEAFARFMLWSSGYPLVYLPCIIMVGVFAFVGWRDLALWISAIPVLFIVVLIGLMVFAFTYGG